MAYFCNVVCANLFFRRVGGVEIDGFGAVSMVRKPSISAFCEQLSIDDEDFVARFDGKY